MSSKPVSTSSHAAYSAGAGAAGAGAAAPDKDDGKMMSVVKQVLAESAFSLMPKENATEENKRKIIQGMALESIEPLLLDAPDLDLSFLNESDWKLLNGIFERTSLTNQLCLLDVLLFDLFQCMEELKPLLLQLRLKQLKTDPFEECYAIMALGYVSQMIETGVLSGDSNAKKVVWADRSDPTAKGKYTAAVSKREWILRLEEIKKTLKQEAAASPKLRGKRGYIDAVASRLDLVCKLLGDKQASQVLTNHGLSDLHSYFKEAVKLNGQPSATLQNLKTFIKCLRALFSSATSQGFLPGNLPVFDMLDDHLTKYPDQEKLVHIRGFKSLLAECIKILLDMRLKSEHELTLAGSGQLSHAEWCKRSGITVARGKSPDEFVGMLCAMVSQCNLVSCFLHDVLKIFDQRIIIPRFPNIYVDTTAVFFRMDVHLGWLIHVSTHAKQIHDAAEVSALEYTPSDLPGETALKGEFFEIHAELENMWAPPLLLEPEFADVIGAHRESLMQVHSKRYDQWIPLIQKVVPAVENFKTLLPKFDVMREKILGAIEKFLNTLSKEELASRGEQMVKELQEVCFHLGLDFCRMAILAKDIDGVLNLHFVINNTNSENQLIPEELSNLMTLDGIEEVLARVRSKFERPMRTDTAGRPPREPKAAAEGAAVGEGAGAGAVQVSTQVKVITAVERAQLLSLGGAPAGTAQPKAPTKTINPLLQAIKIRRGEKNRKVLQRLREMGFLPVRTRGSHTTYEHKETGAKVTGLAGTSHKHLKPGTASSMGKQASKEGKSS